MRRSFAFLTFLALSSLPCSAAVSGTVTDLAGNGLSGVGVSLALAGTSTTTDANGTWSLAPTGIDVRTITTSRTRWTGKAVELTLSEPATVSVETYDIKGAQHGRFSRVKLGAGSHSLPLALSTSGMVWLRVTVNGRSEMVLGGIGMGGASVVEAIHESPLPNPMAARSQGIADTLLFTWKTRAVARIALSNLDTSGIVVKIGTDSSIAWNDSITYGSVYDARNGQVYRSVQIGDQVWMAENLNYAGAGTTVGVCYNSRADSCTKYGRLYTWAEVMAGHVSSSTSPSGVQAICPTGWHVPSDAEWTTMQKVVDASNTTDGTKLKSTAGWNIYNGTSGNGTDTYGFRALPGGNFYGGSSSSAGYYGYWWSATEGDATLAWNRYMYFANASVYRPSYKTYGFSLRCLEDYTISIPVTVASPAFSPVAGTYTSAQIVTLSTTTAGASIYYTVDGSTPTTSSTVYSGAISVGSTEAIKAIAVKSGMTNSAVSSAAYTITTGQTSDTFTDARDGHVYRTVVIGTQTWMAQNLNFTPASSGDSSWCYGGVSSNCATYGRLYQWSAAMGLAASYNTTLWGDSDVKHQGICPSGWHVPNDAEWTKLTDTTLASSTAGTKLKANSTLWSANTGTDDYGFTVLPAGGRDYGGSFRNLGSNAFFWSASEYGASYAWSRIFYDGGYAGVSRHDRDKPIGFSLRCLED